MGHCMVRKRRRKRKRMGVGVDALELWCVTGGVRVEGNVVTKEVNNGGGFRDYIERGWAKPEDWEGVGRGVVGERVDYSIQVMGRGGRGEGGDVVAEVPPACPSECLAAVSVRGFVGSKVVRGGGSFVLGVEFLFAGMEGSTLWGPPGGLVAIRRG